jgi:hypothetical protein
LPPSSDSINPKPFAVLKNFTVPFMANSVGHDPTTIPRQAYTTVRNSGTRRV